MTRDHVIGSAILLFLALIWGVGFIFQRLGMEHIGPFTFNAARFALGALSLLPVLYLFPARLEATSDTRRRLVLIHASFLGGLFFFGGISLQQVGLQFTTAGKSAFITGLYIILVPIFSIFLGQIARSNVWVAAGLALLGLYFLSESEGFAIGYGELLTVFCAVFWALQILVTARFAKRLDMVEFALGQVLVVFVLSLVVAYAVENPIWRDIWKAKWSLAFVGIIDTGLAMILQILGQSRVPATQAGIIMSFEAVFGALAGYLFLAEVISARMFTGCIFMLLGMIVAQITLPRVFKKSSH